MTFLMFSLCFKFLSPSFYHMHFSVQSPFPPQMLYIAVPLISASLFLPFSPLICRTHCEEANPCSSEICEYVVKNVCPS